MPIQNGYARILTLSIVFLVVIGLSTAGVLAEGVPSTGTKTGVSIELEPSVEEEAFANAQEVAEKFSLDIPEHVFLLYERDGSAWFVFTDTEPTEGEATVKGTIVPPEDTGISEGMIFADSVEIQRDGPKVSLNKYKENRDDYRYRVIELTAQFRQVALEEEVQDGRFKYPHATGVVAVEFNKGSFFEAPGQVARWTAINLSSDDIGSNNPISDRIGTFFFAELVFDLQDTSFWIDARTHVDTVIVPRTNEVGHFVAKTDVDENRNSSVREVANTGEDVQGDVISMKADVVGVTLSTREVLLNLAGCAPDSVIVPGAGCVPLVTDVTVHTGFLIGDATKRSDVLAYAALSNTPQDEMVQPETGRYQVKGRVVSASQIDPSLPEGKAFQVYQMERVGDLTLGPGTLEKAETWRGSLVASMKKQINMSDEEFQDYKRELEETPTPSPTATPSPTSTPTEAPTATPTPQPTETGTTHATKDRTQTPGQPGFGIIAVIVAMWLIALLVIRRN